MNTAEGAFVADNGQHLQINREREQWTAKTPGIGLLPLQE